MRSPHIVGIASIIGATTIFTIQDTTIKWLSGGYPLHEIVFVRACIAAAFMLVLIKLEGGLRLLRTAHPKLHLARGLLVVTANSCYFAALAVMPLADAMALFFVAPLFITALSTIFLREQVGLRRWCAVIVGMVGIIVMLRPGEETFRLVALLPIVSAMCYASMQIITRRLGVTDRASTMAFYVHATFFAAGALMFLGVGDGRFATGDNASVQFLLRPWVMPGTRDMAILLVVGTLSAVGAYLMTQAYQVTEVTVVAPFEYTALPLAMLWGLIVFGDLPDGQALLGMGLIVGSGLFVFYRETVVKRRASLAVEADSAARGTPKS